MNFHSQFSKMAVDSAQALYEATLHNSSQDRRQTHSAIQEKLNNALVDIRLYERGLKLLPVGQHAPMIKYLLKTLAADVANELHLYAASESKLVLPAEDTQLTVEQRTKISQDCGNYTDSLNLKIFSIH